MRLFNFWRRASSTTWETLIKKPRYTFVGIDEAARARAKARRELADRARREADRVSVGEDRRSKIQIVA